MESSPFDFNPHDQPDDSETAFQRELARAIERSKVETRMPINVDDDEVDECYVDEHKAHVRTPSPDLAARSRDKKEPAEASSLPSPTETLSAAMSGL